MPWALVTGAKGSGRSAVAREIARRLQADGPRVAGFVQESLPGDGPEGRSGIDLLRLATGERTGLARTGKAPRAGEEEYCSFAFDLAAFAAAARWVDEDAAGAGVLLADEVSRLEGAGRGHHAAVARMLAQAAARPVVLSVRSDQLAAVMEAFRLEEEPLAVLDVPASDEAVQAFVAAVARAARAYGREVG